MLAPHGARWLLLRRREQRRGDVDEPARGPRDDSQSNGAARGRSRIGERRADRRRFCAERLRRRRRNRAVRPDRGHEVPGQRHHQRSAGYGARRDIGAGAGRLDHHCNGCRRMHVDGDDRLRRKLLVLPATGDVRGRGGNGAGLGDVEWPAHHPHGRRRCRSDRPGHRLRKRTVLLLSLECIGQLAGPAIRDGRVRRGRGTSGDAPVPHRRDPDWRQPDVRARAVSDDVRLGGLGHGREYG